MKNAFSGEKISAENITVVSATHYIDLIRVRTIIPTE